MGIFSNYGFAMGELVFKFFNGYTENAMPTQEETLLNIMERNKDTEIGKKYGFADIKTIADFQKKVPISTFESYIPLIERTMNGEETVITGDKILRYCESSGSAGKPKIQPKTTRDVWNMYLLGFVGTLGCISAYFKENGRKKMPTQKGPLLMSLNGHKLPNGKMSNGAGQLPFQYIKPILNIFITTPKDILFPEDEPNTDILYFQLLTSLTERNITYLGSMVITMLTQMFEYLEDNWEMLVDDIEKGTLNSSVRCPQSLRKKYGHRRPNPKRAKELREIFSQGFDKEPIALKIWPKLLYGYGMTGSTLMVYAEKLKRYVGDLPMHNMGYAASEGFMAMCVDMNVQDYVLLPRSLIYEFIPVDEPDIEVPLTLDKLEIGKDYEIIITNFSGLYRYRIMDIVRCTGDYNNSKKIQFLYRSNMGLNVANEKTTTDMLDIAAQKIEEHFGIKLESYSYYGDTSDREAKYMLLLETNADFNPDEISEYLDKIMAEINSKYGKYRSWGMIGMPEIKRLKNGAYARYKAELVKNGRIINQIKPVTVINTPEKKEFFFGEIEG